jgi:hypothetical protein
MTTSLPEGPSLPPTSRLIWALVPSLLCLGLTTGCSADGDNSACEATANSADVVVVTASGSAGHYVFTVSVASPDIGCGCYADWWEIVGLDGHLIARRTLDHAHVDEQPFARAGSDVTISEDLYVIVRAHMASRSDGGAKDAAVGYGGKVMRGSVRDGFTAEDGDPAFAAALRTVEPQPSQCQ